LPEDDVPFEIQEDLRDYVENHLVPDIKEYLAEIIPTLYGYPTRSCDFWRLACHGELMHPAFNPEEQYDLYKMEDILLFPCPRYSVFEAQVSVGAAIRICKAIRKEEHADRINKIAKDIFTPEEHPDMSDKFRSYFFVHLRTILSLHLMKIL
jgi:hypothetical protein